MGDYVQIILKEIDTHLADLWKNMSASSQIIDPVLDFKMLPFFIIAQILYGDLSQDARETLTSMAAERDILFRYVIRGGLTRFAFARLLPLKANRKLLDFKRRWAVFNQDMVLHCQRTGVRKPIVDMHGDMHRGLITREQLYQTLDEILFANLDVTMGGVSWSIVHLAANVKVQDKIRQELELWAAGVEEQTARYLRSSSTYLHNCMLESARLQPLAAFSVPQSAPTDRIIGGYRIPAGTDFVIDTYNLNVRNPFWGQDTKEYKPERFSKYSKTDVRYNYWRFGFGPRQCLGKHIADFLTRALLVRLVEGWILDVPKGQSWTRLNDVWINHPQIRVSWRKHLK
ncbi:MAG: hypothetical protein Q9165_008258 [Trypethelium subeluteriae]